MKHRIRMILSIIPVLLLTAMPLGQAQALTIYAGNAVTIFAADLEVLQQITVATGVSYSYSMDLDVTGGKMYWTLTDGTIRRADLDGANVETIIDQGGSPYGVAVDSAGGKVYWTDFSTDKIQRANLDGSDPEDLVTTGTFGLVNPSMIALDVAGGKMYWADQSAQTINRADLDGSTPEILFNDPVKSPDPYGIALDLINGIMYWTNQSGQICRANLNGTGDQTLLTTANNLYEIELDPANGKMYWMDNSSRRIQRADLVGTNVEDVLVGLGGSNFALALDLTDQTPVDSAFTYQGEVERDSLLVDDSCDLLFSLWTAASGGVQVGAAVEKTGVAISEGRFTTELDFGPTAFASGRQRWLQIQINCPTLDPNSTYSLLSPRQKITGAPYAQAATSSISITQPASAQVPIGTVIDWWRPNSNFPIPLGYSICDGQTLNDPDSPFDGQTLPDMTDRFVRGVTNPTATLGLIGGSAVTTFDTHNHAWSLFNSAEDWYSWQSNGTSTTLMIAWGDGVGAEGSGEYPIGTSSTSSSTRTWYTNDDTHNHEVTPLYVGLLKLMRIK